MHLQDQYDSWKMLKEVHQSVDSVSLYPKLVKLQNLQVSNEETTIEYANWLETWSVTSSRHATYLLLKPKHLTTGLHQDFEQIARRYRLTMLFIIYRYIVSPHCLGELPCITRKWVKSPIFVSSQTYWTEHGWECILHLCGKGTHVETLQDVEKMYVQ